MRSKRKSPDEGDSGGEGWLVRGSVTTASSAVSGSIACYNVSMHFLAVANLVKIAHLDRQAENPPPKPTWRQSYRILSRRPLAWGDAGGRGIWGWSVSLPLKKMPKGC